MTYIIAQPCVDVLDKACIEECPVDCIYEGERMLYIHPDECVDCGACEPVCPVEAIYYEDDVPDQWKEYYKVNVDFFADLGSPGGASKTGKIGKDHPVVAALPPQADGGMTPATLAARLSRFTWDRIAPLREKAGAAPGRRGGPVHGHARRSGARPDPRRAGRGRPTRPGTRRRGARRGCGRAAAGWLARAHGVPVVAGRRAAGRRHQGVHRLASGHARARAGRRDASTRSWRTPPTTSAPGSPGRRAVASDSLLAVGPARVRLVWVNSPSNPTGRVLPRRAPAQGGGVGPGARGGGGLRRVLHHRWAGKPRRSPCCIRTCAARRTRACWPFIRCPSGPTWPATGPGS